MDLTGVLDEALLLTTELVTNGVVHAGTELEIEIIAGVDALSVMVLDRRCGPLSLTGWDATTPGPTPESTERGRGLLLVDRLADRWGTLHHSGGKGVWFQLERPSFTTGRTRPTPGLGSAPGAAVLPSGAFTALGTLGLLSGAAQLPDTGAGDETSLVDLGMRALRRLCEAVGAEAACVQVDEADGQGPRTVATYGPQPAGAGGHAPHLGTGGHGAHLGGGLGALRIPLGLSRPWRGELLVEPVGTTYARPLAELTAERLTLLVENQRLRRADIERRAWLTFLAEAGELLAQSLDVELTLALIPRLVVPRLGLWCAVHTAGTDGELRLAAATHSDEGCLAELLETLRSTVPQIREVLRTDGAVALPAPVDGYAVPLVARGQRLGTLTVGRSGETWPRTEEIAIVEDVARRAALAIDNARIHAERRGVARELQRYLLPPQLPTVVGVEFGAEYVSTGEGVDVGGDFYDVMALPDDRWLIVVGDVSGKGVQVATVTGLVREVTRALARDGRPLPDTLFQLNETLVERGGGRFCTLALAMVSRDAAELDVQLHLAGHDQPILVRLDGTTALVGRCGTALGLFDAVRSPQARIRLQPGESLVFYTDGVTERRRGKELYGQERLRWAAAGLAGFPAGAVAARLRAATLGFSAEVPRDDIAIFVLRNDGVA